MAHTSTAGQVQTKPLEGLPLVLVYPKELLTSYWAEGMRGMSSMLDTGPRLSSEARLRCSSGPPERTGGDAPMPALTSTEPQLFLPLISLSRPILKDTQSLLFNRAESSQGSTERVTLSTVFSGVECCANGQIPEVGAPLNSGRTRKSEHLGIIGIIVHLYGQGVVRVLWSTES